MILNSLNIKGLQKGNSHEALSFQSQSINSKNPQRERDLAYTRHRQRYLQIFFALILMVNTMQSFAQSGNSCGNPISVGNFVKDTTFSISINYPDTVKWLSFSSNESIASFLASSNQINGSNIKIKELNIYNTSCVLVSANPTLSYPGALAEVVKKQAITINQTYLIKITRYYDITLNDTDNIDLLLNYRGGSSSTCGPDLCNGIVYDGGFENYLLTTNGALNIFDLECNWFRPIGGGGPTYFNENYSDPEYQIPNPTYLSPPAINLPTQIDNINFSPSNTGYVGLRTSSNNSDIIQGSLTQSLQSSTSYFISYLVSPGSSGYNSYHDRIDLDIVDPSVMNNYHPNNWGTNYSNATPDLESGVIDFTQTWTRVSNVITPIGGESIVYIGNLAKQAYSTSMNTIPANTYYVDNLIIKPFELELGPDIVACAGETVNIIVPCQYLYPGATYEWLSDDPNIPQPWPDPTDPNLSFTATGNYYYQLIITVQDQTTPSPNQYTIQDVINVTIAPAPAVEITIGGGPQGTYCKVDGTLYVVQGNQVSLTASGAGANGSYDWYVNGTLTASNQSYFFTPGLAPPDDYQIVVIGTDSLCSGSDTINLTIVSNICQLPCNTVLGQSAFVDGNNDLTNYTDGPHDFVSTSAASFNTLPLTGPNLTYVVDGTFTISTNTFLQFEEVTLLISPGGKIVNNGTFNLINCVVDGCEQMWDRIENRADFASSGTTFRHAEAAIELFTNCTTRVDNSTFTDNIVGIYSRKLVNSTAQKTLFYFRVSGSTFQGSAAGINSNLRYPITFSQNTGTGSNPIQQPEFYLRPANGINIQYVSTILIGQNPTILANNTNHFLNMWNGITLVRTRGTINNCRFNGMQANIFHEQLRNIPNLVEPQDVILNNTNPNSTTHYSGIVTNAIANLNRSNLSLSPLFNNDANNPTFNNCFRGILNYQSDIRANDVANPNLAGNMIFMRNVNSGVRVEGVGNLQIATLQQLDIDANNLGIGSYNNIGGGRINIRFNNITMNRIAGYTGQGNMFGIQIRQSDNSNILNGDYTFLVNNNTPQVIQEVNNNVVTINAGARGIETWANNGTNIHDNTVLLNYIAGIANGVGINIENNFNTQVACNLVNSDGISADNQGSQSAAIRVLSSPNSTISCNNMSAFKEGIKVDYPSTNTAIRGNSLMNHRIGIKYEQFANTGDQNNQGNLWAGTFTRGAEMVALNSSMTFSEYRFTNTAPWAPINGFTPPNWFITQTAAEFDCENNPPCTFFDPNRMEGISENYEKNLETDATLKNDSSDFGEEKVWFAANYAIKSSLKNDSLFNSNTVLISFNDSIASTPIYIINEILGKVAMRSIGSDSQNAQLYNLQNEIDSLFEIWQGYSQNNDDLNASNIDIQIQALSEQINLIRDQISVSDNIILDSLLTLLNGVSCVNNLDLNYKSMAQIYLSYLINDDVNYLISNESSIIPLANQCPMAGGQGVYLARSLYYFINPSAQFDDEMVCNAESNQRQSKRINKEILNQISEATLVYPNPTKDIININAKNKAIIAYRLINSFGKEIENKNQLSNSSSGSLIAVNVSDISNGVYILELQFDGNKMERHKITIVH